MPDSSTPAIQISRPMVVIDGQDQPALSSGMLGLLIVEDTQGLYRCELIVGNWGVDKNNQVGYLYFDRQLLDFGKSMQIKVGSDVLFDGRIMALEAQFSEGSSPCMTILAEDRLQDLRMTRRTRSFDNITDANVLTQIANDHGLTPSIQLNGPTYKVLTQVNQSDLAFARERGRAVEAEVWIDGQTLHACHRADRPGEKVTLTYGGNLREFSVLADLAMQRTSVVVSGWDVSSKSAVSYEANDSVINAELNGDKSGASVLSSALGDRKENLAHRVPFTTDEAQAEAEAFFRMQARRFVVGHGVAETDHRLIVGGKVDLSGLGPLFNGTYTLTEVRHKFDLAHGIRTEFTAERPGLG